MADSPKDHIAIANYYQKLAKRARDEVSLHENMADKYQRNQAKIKSPSIGLAAKEHCDRIIKLQQSIAIEYEGLAELHKDAAERWCMALNRSAFVRNVISTKQSSKVVTFEFLPDLF